MKGDFDADQPFVFRLNDNGVGPTLLSKVSSERGWRVYQAYSTNGDDKWNLWWRTSSFPMMTYNALEDWQFMNHIPKGGSICRKDSLSRLLRCMRKIYGPVYDFSPSSFHLPLEYAKLVAECSRLRRCTEDGSGNDTVVWIHKPVAQSQGRGIFLFRVLCVAVPPAMEIVGETVPVFPLMEIHNGNSGTHPKKSDMNVGDMRCGTAAVVQRYIERPLLIAGYKFDLRLYVCVPSYRPLTAYMYAEGLARFGTDKYTLADIHNPYRHITNSSLNKTGPRFDECKDRIGSGCKWTLKQVRRALTGRWGGSEWLVWQRIRSVITLTLLAQAAGTPPTKNCFEFYGFDVLLDDSLKPWLIEVNLSPALAADCEADVTVKGPMLHELFDLLGMPMKNNGLSLLEGSLQSSPNNNSQNNSSSDEEVPLPRTALSITPPMSAVPISMRSRRRRPAPIHRVNLTPAFKGKCITDQRCRRNRPLNIEDSTEFAEDQSVVSGSISSVSETSYEEGSHSVYGKRRSSSYTSSIWGNGINWERAAGRVGHWVRIFPHAFTSYEQMPEEMRESVGQVSKFIRAAKEVARDHGRDSEATRDSSRDARFELALRNKMKLGPEFQMWLPPS